MIISTGTSVRVPWPHMSSKSRVWCDFPLECLLLSASRCWEAVAGPISFRNGHPLLFVPERVQGSYVTHRHDCSASPSIQTLQSNPVTFDPGDSSLFPYQEAGDAKRSVVWNQRGLRALTFFFLFFIFLNAPWDSVNSYGVLKSFDLRYLRPSGFSVRCKQTLTSLFLGFKDTYGAPTVMLSGCPYAGVRSNVTLVCSGLSHQTGVLFRSEIWWVCDCRWWKTPGKWDFLLFGVCLQAEILSRLSVWGWSMSSEKMCLPSGQQETNIAYWIKPLIFLIVMFHDCQLHMKSQYISFWSDPILLELVRASLGSK